MNSSIKLLAGMAVFAASLNCNNPGSTPNNMPNESNDTAGYRQYEKKSADTAGNRSDTMNMHQDTTMKK